MGRPKKKVVKSQGGETTKKIQETKVKTVKIEKSEPKEIPLKKDGTFLVSVNGVDGYFTRVQLNVMFQRNSHTIKIPKGSEYTAPINSNCTDCG